MEAKIEEFLAYVAMAAIFALLLFLRTPGA